MKKLYLLILAVVTTAFASFPASAIDETLKINYKSIGTGYMTDDMLTGWYDYLPVTYEVEIQQADNDLPLYRVIAPYGENFAKAMLEVNNTALKDNQYDKEGVRYIDIDATNPDDVIFRKTMTGCTWTEADGEIYIGVNSSYNATLKDKVITAPKLGIGVGAENTNGAYAMNRRGRFRIVLPGGELNDFEISITPASQCLTERTFKGELTVGSDVAKVVYNVVPEMQEDEMLTYVDIIAGSDIKFTPRGEFSFEMAEDVFKETMIVVALDADGNQVGYDWCTYYFIDEDPDGWYDCGVAEFTDGFLQDLISNIPSQTTKTMLQRNKENPGRLRLVNPYAGLKEYPALSAGHSDHNHYIYINAEDTECIYIEESPIGMESSKYGLMRVSSMVYYFLCAGFDLEECKELEMGAIIEDGVMTFPEEALSFSMLKYDNGDWYQTDSEGVTQIVLPEGFDITSSLKGIAVDESQAPVEYFDLQGIKVAKPQAGKLYLKKQGSVVKKEITL